MNLGSGQKAASARATNPQLVSAQAASQGMRGPCGMPPLDVGRDALAAHVSSLPALGPQPVCACRMRSFVANDCTALGVAPAIRWQGCCWRAHWH